MSNSKCLSWGLLVASMSMPMIGMAYEVGTHYELSSNAFLQSSLPSPVTLANLGLKPLSSNQLFPTSDGDNVGDFADPPTLCSHGVSETIGRLIACGSMFEDYPAVIQSRPLNHFFDPAHGGRALTVPIIPFGPPTWIAGMPSPDWALGNGTPSYQQNSYANARDYFDKALTTPDSQSVRDVNWGKTFQSIGQVIHHLQDMAQPQHVRNDAHANIFGEASNLGPLAPSFHASRFEQDTATDPNLASIAQEAMQGSVVPVYPAYATQFPTPRSFWTGGAAGTGIADYANTNFVSIGTNFCDNGTAPTPNSDFAAPVPTGSQDVSIAQAYLDTYGSLSDVAPSVDGFCQVAGQTPDVYLRNCYVTMVSSTVYDGLPGTAPAQNDKASTYSVFDEDLKLQNQFVPFCATNGTGKVFALNKLNFIATYQFLMPHAVAYSAGLINYFFRGQMVIAPPSEGVYGIFDTSSCFTSECKSLPPNTVAAAGFSKIKLLLKNTTPNDDMGAGTLRAVAKYHLNKCYKPDLSGEYGVQGFTDTCRTTEEYITVSSAVAIDPANGVGNGANSGVGRSFDTQPRVFTFANPIPINASDLVLQVVFKGTLGQEDGAVAVTTKDISEPNFIAIQNFTDYAFNPYTTPPKYIPSGVDPDSDGDTDSQPVTFPNLTVAFGSNIATVGPTAIATLSSLGAGQHAQLALLMDLEACGRSAECPETTNYISMTWDLSRGADAWIPGGPIARGVQEFTTDDTGPYAGQYTKTCPVVLSRGVYRQSDYLFFYQEVQEDDVLGGRTLRRGIASTGQMRSKAAVASDCDEPTTGIFDFSGMTPLNPGAANQWQINF